MRVRYGSDRYPCSLLGNVTFPLSCKPYITLKQNLPIHKDRQIFFNQEFPLGIGILTDAGERIATSRKRSSQ